MEAVLELRDVTVRKSGRAILDRVSLRVAPGEAICVVGRSGSGKTTLLRVANALLAPDEGAVLRGGEALSADTARAHQRRTGTMFQSPALFPHRTVYDNVALRLHLAGQRDVRDEVLRLLRLVGLDDSFASRFPRQLSGGEQQRVGIARALAGGPELLLCDEPFSALDVIIRRELQELFVTIARNSDTTLLFVTHDMREAFLLAERIIVIDGGRIVADGTRDAIMKSDAPIAQRLLIAGGVR